MADLISLEIVADTSGQPSLHRCRVAKHTTVAQVLQQLSLPWQEGYIGIFSRQVASDTVLTHDCRIELYQALKIDPKQARLKRAKNQPLKAH